MIQTFVPDGPNGAFGARIAIRALCRDGYTFDACSRQNGIPPVRVNRVPIVDQVPRISEEAGQRIGEVALDLLQPLAVRTDSDSGDLHGPRLQLDHEEDHV